MRTATRATIAVSAVGAALALPSGAPAASVQKPSCQRTFQGKKQPKRTCVFKLVKGKRFYIPNSRSYYVAYYYFTRLRPDLKRYENTRLGLGPGVVDANVESTAERGKPTLISAWVPFGDPRSNPITGNGPLIGREYTLGTNPGNLTVYVVPTARAVGSDTLYVKTYDARQGRPPAPRDPTR